MALRFILLSNLGVKLLGKINNKDVNTKKLAGSGIFRANCRNKL